MLKRKQDEVKEALDVQIMNLFTLLNSKEKFDSDYDKMVVALTKLYDLRSKERLSIDTVVNVVTHLGGLIVLMQHERVHVIASKAFGLLRKIG